MKKDIIRIGFISITLALLGAVSVFAGGGREQAGSGIPKELNFYTYYAENSIPVTDAALTAMKAKYPNLKVNIEHRADSDGSTLKARAAIGEMPDVYECVGSSVVDSFIKSGDMLVLDDIIQKTGLFNEFLDGTFNNTRYSDGHYYTLVSDTPNAFLVYYNIAVFRELGLQPPKNFTEFKALIPPLLRAGKIPLALFGAEQWPGLQLYDLAVIGSGEPQGITGLDGGVTKITDPAYRTAAQRLKEMVDLGLIGRAAFSTNASQAFELCSTGAAGMVANGGWHFATAMTEGYGENMGYFSYNPFGDPGREETIRWNMSGGRTGLDGWAVYPKGKYAEFAAQWLMDFIIEYSKANAQINPSMLKNPPKPKDPRPTPYEAYVSSLGNYKSTTKFSWDLNNAEIMVALSDGVELLLAGNYTVDQFMADLERKLSAVRR
ncbi:MAG: extracellular solute-binding protein [Treponema sp.]|nr:extracellular solute-binding protein [Treponema sp.]